MTTSKHRIETVLVVDDDASLRRAATRALERQGRLALTASSHAEALHIFRDEHIDLAVLDLVLRDESGLELLRRLKALRPGLTVVLMSGLFCVSTVVHAYRAGAFDCVEKPFEWAALLHTLEHDLPIESHRNSDIPTLEQWKREYYSRLLAIAGGNVTKAAELAGIRRTSLQRILRQGIRDESPADS